MCVCVLSFLFKEFWNCSDCIVQAVAQPPSYDAFLVEDWRHVWAAGAVQTAGRDRAAIDGSTHWKCRDGMVDWKSKPNRTATIQLIEGLLVLPRCWPARGSLASHSVAPPRTFLVAVLLYRLQEVLKNLADDQARSMLWQWHGIMMIYDVYYDICIVLWHGTYGLAPAIDCKTHIALAHFCWSKTVLQSLVLQAKVEVVQKQQVLPQWCHWSKHST